MEYLALALFFSVWCFLAWRKPKFAVLVFPAVLPLYLIRTKIGPLPTTFLEGAWLATLCGVTLRQGLVPWRRGLTTARPWLWALGLWCLATAVAVGVAPNHMAALGLWRAYILEPVLLFFLLNGTLEDAQDRWTVIKSFIAVTLLIVAWSAFQFITGQGIPSPWNTGLLTRRATGPFPFPNAVSLFCAPLAALFFGFAVGDGTRRLTRGNQFLLWIGFASASLATLLAKSVGGTLAILAAVVVALIAKKRTRSWTLATLVLGLTIIFTVPQFRVPTIQTLTFNGWSGRVRLWMYQETWDMLRDRPFWGAGFGAYPETFKPYHKKTFIEIFQYPHDIILNLWSETGLLGLVGFFWICAIWFHLARRRDHGSRHDLAYMLPLIAILVQGLVDVPYFKNDLAFTFWILAALAATTD